MALKVVDNQYSNVIKAYRKLREKKRNKGELTQMGWMVFEVPTECESWGLKSEMEALRGETKVAVKENGGSFALLNH